MRRRRKNLPLGGRFFPACQKSIEKECHCEEPPKRRRRTPGWSLLPFGQFTSWQSPGGWLDNLSSKVHRKCSMLIEWPVISVGAGDCHGPSGLARTFCSLHGFIGRYRFGNRYRFGVVMTTPSNRVENKLVAGASFFGNPLPFREHLCYNQQQC